MLYEKGGYYDKAAAVYIRSKNWYVCSSLQKYVYNNQVAKHSQKLQLYKANMIKVQ